ncbi:putative inorganic carbon transporter subunit DabA [Pantoea ananatis]
MTAPMLVSGTLDQLAVSRIHFADPQRLGSGNKVLRWYNVGGRIGVFEGNGGDLRIGLSRQSLHDGERWDARAAAPAGQ